MKTKSFVFGILMIIGFASLSVQSSSVNDAAIKLVETLRIGSNLQVLGFQVAKRTPGYQMAVSVIGEERTNIIVKEELAKRALEYQDQWNLNLASSYAEYFKEEELESITKDKEKSKYFDKFLDMQNMVGPTMKRKSNDLLIKYVNESVKNALSVVASLHEFKNTKVN